MSNEQPAATDATRASPSTMMAASSSTAAADALAAVKARMGMAAAAKAMSSTTTHAHEPALQAPAGFQVMCTGQVESVDFSGINNLYCRYAITYGTDWRMLHGTDAGLSQIAYKAAQDDQIVLNFPIDVSFKSTNPYGWPRLVLSFYGLDALGRDVVRGYGSMHFPTCAGRTTREVPLFRPLSSSLMQQFTAWLTGSQPEYFDSKFITQNDGREITRVTSAGKAKVVLNVITSGMKQFRYS